MTVMRVLDIEEYYNINAAISGNTSDLYVMVTNPKSQQLCIYIIVYTVTTVREVLGSTTASKRFL